MSEGTTNSNRRLRRWLTLAVGCAAVSAFLWWAAIRPANQLPPAPAEKVGDHRGRTLKADKPRSVHVGPITLWWDAAPKWVRDGSHRATAPSNIALRDYSGSESCKKCHAENYLKWSQHPHRWMNTVANATTIKGDFSGKSAISYRGGTARFYWDGNEYRMELQGNNVRRVYRIAQTIGSRFQQYYIGTLVSGPEDKRHDAYRVNHVLPFGYWLSRKSWVPTVHVHEVDNNGVFVDEERFESFRRPDPFAKQLAAFTPYSERCSHCHTTLPFGDLLVRNTGTLSRHAPRPLDLSLPGYLSQSHSALWERTKLTDLDSFRDLVEDMQNMEPSSHAATLGVSCEACHLGSKAHAEGKLGKPSFVPISPYLFTSKKDAGDQLRVGRTQRNLNWACARCHAGDRPHFAAGMSTWNSTEYSDAVKGNCYSKLTCVHCHEPHTATGRKWSHSSTHDDALCLKCHQKFEATEARREHTHHRPGSPGSRCMNCHMPRLNEGMEDVVRTHMIFSPSNRQMIEANHPNACNLCHTRESIDWTVRYLKEWYGAEFSDAAIVRAYPRRKQPTALGWLKSPEKSVRLIAADALTRTKSHWALSELIEALDDPFLLNRQFAMLGLETMLNERLIRFDYRFYMMRGERERPMERIRRELLKGLNVRRKRRRGR